MALLYWLANARLKKLVELRTRELQESEQRQREVFDLAPVPIMVENYEALVPELAKMPPKWIHHPWEAPADVLGGAGVTLGDTYPHPIIDHDFARKRALQTYKASSQENAA